MKTELLIQDIEKYFPFVEKPNSLDIPFHRSGCNQCNCLVEDLEPYKDKEVSVNGIREAYIEMSCLSPKAWRWLLPSYLRQCVFFIHESTDFTEYLIYNLSPGQAHEHDASERLSELNQDQLNCILSFLNWCQGPEHWASKYCSEDISKAIVFINKLRF
jgi:hypothetical protein